MNEVNQEKLLKAFANKRRLLLLRLLQNSGELIVTDLAKRIGLSFRATSQHLRVLGNAGVVKTRKEDLYVFYSIAGDKKRLVSHILNL